MKFDVSSLPKDAIVLNAELGMYEYGATNTTAKQLGAYRATKSWTTAATWNKYDSTNSWTTAGGDFDTANAVINPSVGSSAGWKYWWPTNIVAGWVSGAQSNQGFLLKDDGTHVTNKVNFRGRNYATSGYAPYLDVDFSPRTGSGPGYKFDSHQLNDRISLGVNVANGNMLVTQNDLDIAGTNGLDAKVTRFYNSGWDHSYWGGYGRGWTGTLGIDAWMHVSGDGSVAVYMGDGSAYAYVKNPDGSFQMPPGINADLTENADGRHYTLSFRRTGEKWLFDTAGSTTAASTSSTTGRATRSSRICPRTRST